MPISVTKTGLAGVLLLSPQRIHDHRGWFEESWSRRDFVDAGIETDFVQDNHSVSELAGTLRGFHCQLPPCAQDKLVRCTRGKILDVAVDFRRNSPTFGQWEAHELSADSGQQLFVPKGFLHGFLTLADSTHVQYRCSDYYAPECEITVAWNSLGIEWPIENPPILSVRDQEAKPFAEFESPFVWQGEA